jgi:hypothetical protein
MTTPRHIGTVTEVGSLNRKKLSLGAGRMESEGSIKPTGF